MKYIIKVDLENLRESIQEDLLCLLDGLPPELQTAACQIIVDNVNKLINSAE